MSVPKAQIVLGYKEVYNIDPPTDRLTLLKGIDRKHIITEIAGLNYQIKPKTKISFDYSEKFQLDQLEYFSPTKEIYRLYKTSFEKYKSTANSAPVYFCRQGCLFALEEIINCDQIIKIEGFEMAKPEVWEAILKYLLAVNTHITMYKKQKEKIPGFEELNSQLLPLNELTIETDPFYTPFRGYWLMKHFENITKYSGELTEFFRLRYGITPEQFVYNILNLYFTNKQQKDILDFYYRPSTDALSFIDALSQIYKSKEIIKLLSIRKYPMIKIDEGEYVLTDAVSLIEKTYNQFINDFWFDQLKNKTNKAGIAIYDVSDYHSEIGRFFENYTSVLLKSCFEKYKYAKLLLFNDLAVTTSQGNIEIADFYLRYGNKILIGEVKSGYIYDKAKYGGDVNALYKNDREKFFEDFGVTQVVIQICNLVENIKRIDKGFPIGHKLTVYPVIIFNDKSLQTPLMAEVFNKRFLEISTIIKIPKMELKSLSLIHINDLERLEKNLIDNPNDIWRILYYHTQDKRFIQPFYTTVFHYLHGTEYSRRVLDLHKKLIRLYGP